MSEKRFEVLFYGDVINCVRDETGKEYNLHETIDILMDQQDTINKLQDTLFAKEKTIDRLENTIAHLNQSDNSLKKNKKITELANIIHNMKMVLSNDEKQITKIIKAYQDEIDKWKGRTLILLKEMEDE